MRAPLPDPVKTSPKQSRPREDPGRGPSRKRRAHWTPRGFEHFKKKARAATRAQIGESRCLTTEFYGLGCPPFKIKVSAIALAKGHTMPSLGPRPIKSGWRPRGRPHAENSLRCGHSPAAPCWSGSITRSDCESSGLMSAKSISGNLPSRCARSSARSEFVNVWAPSDGFGRARP